MTVSISKLSTLFAILFCALSSIYSQNSKNIAFNTSFGAYKPLEYNYNTYNSTTGSGFIYQRLATEYDGFFDQYCINTKYGLSFEWKWKRIAINLGVNYSRSYNNYAYEHRYLTDNLYGKFKVKEKFTALTFDPLVKIKVFNLENVQFDGVIGMELENLVNYIQTERSSSIGTFENGENTESSHTTNKNRIVAYGYNLYLRPFAGFSATFDLKERLLFEVRPLVTMGANTFSDDWNYTLSFKPYSVGKYRSSITLSTVVSVGYKL